MNGNVEKPWKYICRCFTPILFLACFSPNRYQCNLRLRQVRYKYNNFSIENTRHLFLNLNLTSSCSLYTICKAAFYASGKREDDVILRSSRGRIQIMYMYSPLERTQCLQRIATSLMLEEYQLEVGKKIRNVVMSVGHEREQIVRRLL